MADRPQGVSHEVWREEVLAQLDAKVAGFDKSISDVELDRRFAQYGHLVTPPKNVGELMVLQAKTQARDAAADPSRAYGLSTARRGNVSMPWVR